MTLLESLTRQGEDLTCYIGHAKVSSFLQCLQRLDAITKTCLRRSCLKFGQMIFLDIKEDAAHLSKCMQVLEIKISPNLEDRLCKPRDIHFRYRDSITAHFIYGFLLVRSP